MGDAAGNITLYHNLYIGSLVICILCLILAVVLFFVLDIRSVWGFLTGRKAKKQIQQMEESSAGSGRLMTRKRSNMQNMAQGIQEDMGLRTTVTPGVRRVANAVQNAPARTEPIRIEQPAPSSQPNEGADATSLLRQDTPAQTDESAIPTPVPVPSSGSSETPSDATGMLNIAQTVIGTFAIEKEIILIHAEEVI